MDQVFYIFGSKSSVDYDVLLIVDELKTIDENHKLIKEWNKKLEKQFVEAGLEYKKVNCNLGVYGMGQIIAVFKGTYDEVNNSLFWTYGHHKQFWELNIKAPYDRINNNYFKHLKLKRCYRFLLSFYSRVPELREDIKLALRGDFKKRSEVLNLINFNKHTQFPKKKDKIEDIYKVIAFQLAQTIGLFKGFEIYTKEDVLLHFPRLKNFIMRQPFSQMDLSTLNMYLTLLLVIGDKEKSKMKDLNEEIFNDI
jgi:hypothetical protein